MAKYRYHLPQLDGELFLTDGGLETTLIFHKGLDLPYFAAFDLLKDAMGQAALEKYYRTYLKIAQRFRTGFVLESPTWRANADWGELLGYSTEALAEANRQSIQLMESLRQDYDTHQTPIVISGCVGPRGDGYVADSAMSSQEAAAYHLPQIQTLVQSGVDLVSAMTINYVEEAIGIVQAAQQADIPVVISFTIETDGCLPTGQPLAAAIARVDAATAAYPAYYAVNCAHPVHFQLKSSKDEILRDRLQGLRANASRMSHAELDAADELDDGNPNQLGQEYIQLKHTFPALNVLGGCCGTDHRHVEKVAAACQSLFPSLATLV